MAKLLQQTWIKSILDRIKNTTFYRENDVILREVNFFGRSLLIGVVVSLGASLLEGAGIGLLVTLLQGLSGETKAPSLAIENQDWFHVWILGIHLDPEARILRVSALILFVTFIRAILMYLGSRSLVTAQIQLLHQIRIRIFDQLQLLQLSFFTKGKSGDLINTMTTEINMLKVATGSISILISRGLYLPVYFIFVALISPSLALTTAGLLLILPLAFLIVRKKIRSLSIKLTQANQSMTALTIEFISGIQTIQSFAAQSFERQRFASGINRIDSALHRINKWQATSDPMAELLGLGVMIIMVYFGYSVFKLPLSSLLAFVYVLLRLVQNLRNINMAAAGLSQLHGSINAIKRVLRREDKPYFCNGNILFPSFRDSIIFSGVGFGYLPEQQILNEINLEIKKGQTFAFVGTSGSGKSTLVALLMRLYDPTQGKILIDNLDSRDYEISSLRKRIAIVSQDTFLFNASIQENIAYGLENVTQDDIAEAARIAYATEFIDVLPEGFNTQLGDRGVRLSGGQRQRIAIARAVLRNPEILILDEATSALDTVSEKWVQTALESVTQNRTVIIIAHRLSTIANADQVVILENGMISEQGSYAELMNRKGKLWAYSTAAELS